MESYVYSNGTGNAVMTKTQAGPHPDTPETPRWVGTGRTVLNNKGNVVKQYEPYFSPNHHFETETAIVENGVTPIFHYDPLGRNIKTNFPDGTLTRVEFTPWQQKSYDQNDTILESQWYTAAQAGITAMQRAAQISAPHANTPQVVDFDTLGRPFQTTDDNAAEGKYTVHQTLDIAGRPIIITDAKGRQMTTHQMGMVNPLQTTNIDSGSRWTVNDVAGKPLYMWDSRNHQIKHTYDQLQRPTLVTLSALSALVVEKTVYGTDPTKNNIGQVQFHYDQSGKTEIESYDFKGNPLKTIKQFCDDFENTIDWNAAPTLQTETFETEFTYDALNRPVTQTQPDGTVIANTYNKAGLLETVAKDNVLYVTNINYNEKGQRTDIYYGNGSKTRYYYNPLNFRLTRMLTTRNTGQDILQDLNYTYDPVGNITEQVDNAQQIHYFSNSVIEPRGMYKYDALYRLVEATGRELTSLQLPTHTDFTNNIAVPNTAPNALQNYTHQYQYDQLGNILQMKSVGQWTRDYFYNTDDNKLLGHTNGVTEYTYDNHGNITSMPHLTAMNWDYKDQLLGATNGTFSSYYVYDASGNRVRKVVVKGNIVEERYYLGDYELFRKTTNGTLDYERKTIHISDDKKKIATVETKTGETEVVRYQYNNHLGSASLELEGTAAIISYEEYHPFGTTSYRSGRTETEVSLKRYKYVGKERDEETGLYYYGARYYASWIARFVSVDPLQHKYPYYTPYQYAGNKPISYIDLDGLEEGLTPYMEKASYFKVSDLSDAAHNVNALFYNSLIVNTYNLTSGIINAVYNYKETGSAIASSKIGEYVKTAYNEGAAIATDKALNDIGNYTNNAIKSTTWENTLNGVSSWENWESAVEFVVGAKGSKVLKATKPKISSNYTNDLQEYVFRGDTRAPFTIKREGGFLAKGKYDDLIGNTLKSNPESAFICTSTEREIAGLFAEDKFRKFGYLYKIKNTGEGIDVNAFFESKGLTNKYSWQKEITFKGSISIKNIESFQYTYKGQIISNEIPMSLIKD